MSLSKKKVKGVLLWLRDLMKWFSEDPSSRYNEVMKQLNTHSKLLKEAFQEVIEPEFQEYVSIIAGFLQTGGVEEPTEREESEDNQGDNDEVHGGSQEGQGSGADKVQRVAQD